MGQGLDRIGGELFEQGNNLIFLGWRLFAEKRGSSRLEGHELN